MEILGVWVCPYGYRFPGVSFDVDSRSVEGWYIHNKKFSFDVHHVKTKEKEGRVM